MSDLANIEVLTKIIELILKTIDSPEFLEKFRIGNTFIRDRILTFPKMVRMLLSMGRTGLTPELDRFREKFPKLLPELKDKKGKSKTVSKAAFSKARQNINPDVFRYLLFLCVSTYLNFFTFGTYWEDTYHLFAIDGTDIQMPQKEQCLKSFGAHKDRKGYPFVMGKGSALYSITAGIIVDFRLKTYKFCERTLAVEHIKYLVTLSFDKIPLILFDRGYYSHDLCRTLVENGVKFVIRGKKNLRMVKELIRTDERDKIFRLKFKDGTSIPVRVVRLNLGGQAGEEYLITNIMDQNVTLKMFKELYFRRWGIELSYRSLKKDHLLEDFTGYTEISVTQDCVIRCIQYNLAAISRKDADLAIYQECIRRAEECALIGKDTPPMYKSKQVRAVEKIHRSLGGMLFGTCDIYSKCREIHEYLCIPENWCEIMPDRQYERILKQPTRKFHHNQKKCA